LIKRIIFTYDEHVATILLASAQFSESFSKQTFPQLTRLTWLLFINSSEMVS